MHVLLLLFLVVFVSRIGLPFEEQLVIQGICILFCVPDMILAFRKSPPFVPSFKRDYTVMMQLAQIHKGEQVIDPGCGDGRLVFAATQAGATAIGYELAFPAFVYAKVRSLFYPGSTIRFADFWKQDYTNADVILCYLLPETMEKFYREIWPQLKKGARVVSHAFRMKDLTPAKSERGIHLYIK